MPRRHLLIVILIALVGQTGRADAMQADSHNTAPIEYLVVGTVVRVHPSSSSIAIRGASLLEHLHIRVIAFRVKQPSTLVDLRPGDAITAVFSKKDGMLHRVKRVQGHSSPPPSQKEQMR